MNYKNVAIIITFFSLWLTVYFTHASQEFVAFILIFSLGILHGSNDLMLIAKLNSVSKPLQLAHFFISYIITVAAAAVLFYYVPILALIAFVIFSAFHFGEQHWSDSVSKPNRIHRLLFLTYGLSILFLLFVLNSVATIDVIIALTGVALSEQWFLWGFVISSIMWVLQLGILTAKKSMSSQQLVFELFLILVFAIVFKTATLLWGFAIYFIFWHSIPSIFKQQSYLYGEVSWQTFWTYLRSSFLIWLISIASLIIPFLWLKDDTIFLPLLFAFLGAITFAHSFVISQMFRSDT